MLLVHSTLPECALQMHEVSLKFLSWLSSYRAAGNSIANDQREITQIYPKQSYGSCA